MNITAFILCGESNQFSINSEFFKKILSISIYKAVIEESIRKEESLDIPKECLHYIKNKIIDVLTFSQIRTYFGEYNIIRIDDIYGRK